MKKVKSIKNSKSKKVQKLKVSPLIKGIKDIARKKPDSLAIAETVGWKLNGMARYDTRTFAEIDCESDRIAHGLKKAGITSGMHTVLMVPPGIAYLELLSALFKVGAIPILLDPGMETKKLKNCLEKTKPGAFIGITKAHLMRVLLGWGSQTINITVTLGKRLLWGGYTLGQIKSLGSNEPYVTDKIYDKQTILIVFTGGNTGLPKGVVITHENFNAQFDILKKDFKIGMNDIDLVTFPILSIFGLASGCSLVIPDMNTSRPGRSNQKKLIRTINDYQCTNLFTSPAIIHRLGKYCNEGGHKLPSLKKVFSAGAPARMNSLERFVHRLSPGVGLQALYGSVEALPVSSISSSILLGDARKINARGGGFCIGKPIKNVDIAIIKITEDPVENWSNKIKVNDGQIGEICVKGSIVSNVYYDRPVLTSLAKIEDSRNSDVWHRMGDLGYFDKKKRLWMCGRKEDRLEIRDGTFYTIPCEAVFNNHPDVFRSALVGVKQGTKTIPVICIELEKGLRIKSSSKKRLIRKFLTMAIEHEHTKSIKTFIFHPEFPVDHRHKANINRKKLAEWAERKLK